MRDANCLFCKIVAGEIPATIVHRDERVLAFRDVDPKAPVHILVIPLEHLPDAGQVAEHDPALVGSMVAAGRAVAEREGVAESGYRMVLNTGTDGGQTVFHAHLHLLGGRPLGWPPG